MCGRSLADRCQRAGCDARYSPLPGLPRSNGTTASRHRRPQVPLSRNYRRAMPPAIAGAGERPLGPIRRPPPWRAAKPRRGCAPSLVAARQIGKHHAIATAAAIDQNAVSRRVTHASHASPLSQLRGQRRVGALARPVFVAYSRGRLLPTSGHIYARRASALARPLPADRLASVPASSEMFAVTNRPIVRRCKGNRALAHRRAAGFLNLSQPLVRPER